MLINKRAWSPHDSTTCERHATASCSSHDNVCWQVLQLQQESKQLESELAAAQVALTSKAQNHRVPHLPASVDAATPAHPAASRIQGKLKLC